MIGSRRRNRRDTFDAPLPVVEADVAHHAEAYSPTETITVVPDETMILDPEPAEAEPEPLPHAGYAIGPQILTEHPQWRWVFPFPLPAAPYGWVDVSEATRGAVEDFLGADPTGWAIGGAPRPHLHRGNRQRTRRGPDPA